MGRLSNNRIIEILRQRGHYAAADDLEKILQTRFNFGYSHKKVLVVLYIMGTLMKPLKVPQRRSKKNPEKKITDPRAFWQSIEWLFQGASNTFKARYQELKQHTNFVVETDPGEYAISIAGVKRIRELINYDRDTRNFFFELINRIYDEDTKQARFLKSVLRKTRNWHPIEESKLRYIVEGLS